MTPERLREIATMQLPYVSDRMQITYDDVKELKALAQFALDTRELTDKWRKTVFSAVSGQMADELEATAKKHGIGE